MLVYPFKLISSFGGLTFNLSHSLFDDIILVLKISESRKRREDKFGQSSGKNVGLG